MNTEMGNRQAYTLTHVGKDGFRVYTLPNYGPRAAEATPELAVKRMREILASNSPDRLRDVYGPHVMDTLRVESVEVYHHGERVQGCHGGEYVPAMDTTHTPEERETLAGVLASVGVQVIR